MKTVLSKYYRVTRQHPRDEAYDRPSHRLTPTHDVVSDAMIMLSLLLIDAIVVKFFIKKRKRKIYYFFLKKMIE